MKLPVTTVPGVRYMDIINVTESEIAALLKLSRTELLALPSIMKMKYLTAFQARHIKLTTVAKDLMCLLEPFSGTNIIFLIGATHVGKTTLAKRLVKILIDRIHTENGMEPSVVPFIFIPAPANGAKSLSWVAIYESILRCSNEVLVEKKQVNIIEDGIMSVKPRRYKNLPALRDALDSMLRHRKVLVLAIDEAYHLLRFGDSPAVMDTLKSIADNTGVKLLLIGSYDLFALASSYGQVISRSEILHFERYNHDNKNDVIEYFNILKKVESHWPCECVPTFSTISKELMEASIGCVGLLKKILLRALEMQLKNNGQWDPIFLTKVAKSEGQLKVLREEITKGEKTIKGATYGETIFSGDILEDAIAKMNGTATHA
jgi:hypothetical protein